MRPICSCWPDRLWWGYEDPEVLQHLVSVTAQSSFTEQKSNPVTRQIVTWIGWDAPPPSPLPHNPAVCAWVKQAGKFLRFLRGNLCMYNYAGFLESREKYEHVRCRMVRFMWLWARDGAVWELPTALDLQTPHLLHPQLAHPRSTHLEDLQHRWAWLMEVISSCFLENGQMRGKSDLMCDVNSVIVCFRPSA